MISLYRKYRPQRFSEVIGQESVVRTLQSAVADKTVAHAYVFAGGRGIGKTSIARILAHELGVTDKDLYEIDAASHTGVDDIRALRDGVSTLPMESPYKVYILDEAHMLSKSAFNALLKTLEEPPAHVIFMLATTEIEKIPDTVLSRCEVHTLERPSQSVLTTLVETVAKKEGYTIPKEAANVLGMTGDGSFRDTLSLLQQVLTATEGKKVTLDVVERASGAPSHVVIQKVLSALTEGNASEVLGLIAEARTRHTNASVFMQLLVHMIRAILFVRLAPELASKLSEHFSSEDMQFISARAEHKGTRLPINSKMLLVFLESAKDIAHAPDPYIYIEVACVQLLEKIAPEVV
ncbi:MAG: DNA polymerase III subunit gamma/tau [Minisyncoccia bacterium]